MNRHVLVVGDPGALPDGQRPWRVATCSSPADALVLLAGGAPCDVVVCAGLPAVDALDFLGRLRADHPDAVRLLLAGPNVGFTHAEVGAYLLGVWGLPATVVGRWPTTTPPPPCRAAPSRSSTPSRDDATSAPGMRGKRWATSRLSKVSRRRAAESRGGRGPTYPDAPGVPGSLRSAAAALR